MKSNLIDKWDEPIPKMAIVKKANFPLFSMDAVKTIPISVNPIMQEAIKQTNALGYSHNHPLHIDMCQLIYNKLSGVTNGY